MVMINSFVRGYIQYLLGVFVSSILVRSMCLFSPNIVVLFLSSVTESEVTVTSILPGFVTKVNLYRYFLGGGGG